MIYLILGILIVIIAGTAKGLSDRIDFHSYTLPDWMQNEFWRISGWRNKWAIDESGELMYSDKDEGFMWVKNGDAYMKERFWGSSRWFVMFTDGWHLTQEIYKLSTIVGSIILNIGIGHYLLIGFWLVLLITIILAALLVSLGFYITYR